MKALFYNTQALDGTDPEVLGTTVWVWCYLGSPASCTQSNQYYNEMARAA